MESDYMQQHHTPQDGHLKTTDVVILPAPTAWPFVLALGVALMLAGMVTHWVISLLGLILTLRAAFGWFFQVFPHEHHISVPVQAEIVEITSSRTARERLPEGVMHRKLIPLETFSIIAGLKGGIAGGLAMTVPAGIYSVVRHHSFWYAVNLLAAGGFISWAGQSDAFLGQFHLEGLLAATAIHGLTSVLVGLLYGAMLPMFPYKPILTAGFIAPFIWTGILHSTLGIISPILDARIDWFWFVLSQIAFGLVCGFVVNLQVKITTPQFRALPFAVRAGLHLDHPPEMKDETKDDEK
jgi:hypothetical protein